MTTPCADCADNTDPRKLVREGTNRAQRAAAAPDPAKVLLDERHPEHAMVFAAAYSSYLRYFDAENKPNGDWHDFFSSDPSVQLAIAAVEDIAVYRSTVKSRLRSLEDPELPPSESTMLNALGSIFHLLGSLARRLDELKERLPPRHPLRATMSNLVRTQLSPMLRRLIGFYRAAPSRDLHIAGPPPTDLRILGRPVESFAALLNTPLSRDWPQGVDLDSWSAYIGVDAASYTGAFGPGTTGVERINHLATHNLFVAVGETFLRVYARVVADARSAVEASFGSPDHEPHYALFLAFLRLLEHARAQANTITARHLDFYYRQVLRLQERPAEPSQAHVLVELAKHTGSDLIAAGTLLKAGKDETGADVRFAVDRDLVANKAKVTELKSVYRHHDSTDEMIPFHDGRLFASPVTDSDDGLGAKLTTPDGSWHPFANKAYRDGKLSSIRMPPAEVGFAIASHYLWLAEGERTITVNFETIGTSEGSNTELAVDLLCRLTTEKGWIDKQVGSMPIGENGLTLTVKIDGNDPAITPYVPKTHGYDFHTSLPMLVVSLRHASGKPWRYSALDNLGLKRLSLQVSVNGLRTLTLSNDLGPVDASKQFQPFGPAPVTGSALVIGSTEVFQKELTSLKLHPTFVDAPHAHNTSPKIEADYLDGGNWTTFKNTSFDVEGIVGPTTYGLPAPRTPRIDTPNLTTAERYSTSARNGFVRLRLTDDFGFDTYPGDLASAIVNPAPKLPQPPIVPTIGPLALEYEATQTIDLSSPLPDNSPEARGRFFHVTPFGHAEQLPPGPGQSKVTLLPQFTTGRDATFEAELCLGISDLVPPQNLALLFRVVDGTANPLVTKPKEHIRWSYLRGTEWVPFANEAVDDGTSGLLESGIVVLAVPADASNDSPLLPAGKHWIRLAVASDSDAVCRLVTVAAQAARATHVVGDRGSASVARELPAGTITKLDRPAAGVKGVAQPFPSSGGRPAETPVEFATRVSERLRHKDRAIALWDYEHLILDAFPAIYQARCLNHTRYGPDSSGAIVYRELAPGHVTVVTIPDQRVPNPRDPLRPYTSLRVLGDIERFVAQRLSCFAKLHVRNPLFEGVRVQLHARFRDGVDEMFHVNKLQAEITQFLSPWAFDSDVRPTFDGRLRKSVLIDFIEQREYVDYITDVELFHRYLKRDKAGRLVPTERRAVENVEGSRAISILVSVPAAEHNVFVIRPEDVVADEHVTATSRSV